ncbi:MAG: saccharopine dehydrogenase family protein [Pseudomonadota bacterium]
MAGHKQFDLVIYGASGFTGRLVAEYMTQEYGSRVRWAMAGRNVDKLAQVRDETGAPAETPLLYADASEPASIREMVRVTGCVLTTVGPYQLYGSELVAACAELGTHYVDLCGEPAWMHQMIASHSDTAARSGARIVFSCGFDSIPFDLGVWRLQQAAIKMYGRPMPRVRGRVRAMEGGFSGGTAASFRATLAAIAQNPGIRGVLVNPFALANGFTGPAQPADNKSYEDEVVGAWVAPFMMASINTKNVHRSNALLGHLYGEDFQYDEMMVTGPGEPGQAAARIVATSNPLAADDLPAPGEGPSRAEREAGYYDVLFVGTSSRGEEIRLAVTGDMDAGYGSTSKMIAESALCLVQDCDDLPGGIYTPAPAMGQKLIDRLVARAGMTFDLLDATDT